MHDDIAAAEDRGREQNVDDRVSQRFSVNQKKSEESPRVAPIESSPAFSEPGLDGEKEVSSRSDG